MAMHLPSRLGRLRYLFAAAFIALAGVTVATSAEQAEPGTTTRTLYASIVDTAGQPVLNLGAADVQVRENGVLRPVEIEPATEPLRVALIVSQIARHDRLLESARALCNALDGSAEISVISVIGDAEVLSGFSSRSADCLAALNRVEQKQGFGSHMDPALVEGILKTSSTISREGWRSAIVVLREGAERPTPLYGDRLREPIRASGAVLYVASTRGAADQLTQPLGLAMSTIVDGAIESGGRHVMLGFEASVMQQLASEIATRYRIRYLAAAHPSEDARISVSTLRPGARILAPTRISH
jgi:hypothetical protein